MNFLQKFREKQHSVLLVNTIMLYILRFSTIFLSFITQGYQSRVLGMELLGTLGAAQYTTNFFQIFIDFGFILSATAEVSRQRDDKKALSRVLTSVVLAKTAFIAISFAVLFLFVAPGLKDDKEVLTYVLFLVGTALNSFLPDFMYRGLEQMTTITVRAVSIRAFATAMIFLFIHAPGTITWCPCSPPWATPGPWCLSIGTCFARSRWAFAGSPWARCGGRSATPSSFSCPRRSPQCTATPMASS